MKTQHTQWLLRLVPAFIMFQTLFFKFSANKESVFIFSSLGAEPFGRIATGIMELLACILLLTPRTTFWGALLGFFLMAGAVASHLFVLGIEVQGDCGQLFFYALLTLTCCCILLFYDRHKFTTFFNR